MATKKVTLLPVGTAVNAEDTVVYTQGGVVKIARADAMPLSVPQSQALALKVDSNQVQGLITAATDPIAAAAAQAAADRATQTGFDASLVNEITASAYTIVLSDALVEHSVKMNSPTAQRVNIPLHANVPIPLNRDIPILAWGAGAVTIAGVAGVTLRPSPVIQIARQYGEVRLRKVGTNEWLAVGDIAATGAPVNQAPPSISGGPAAGSTFTRVLGTWAGTPSPTVTGQWHFLVAGVPTPIGGANSSTYASANPADAGKILVWIDSAINTAVGSPVTAQSNQITITSAAATKPVNSSLPQISGTPAVNSTLTVTSGGWSNSPTTYKYQWFSNGSLIRDSGFIAGTTDTYLLTAAEAGTNITVTVTAHNASGDTDNPATSAQFPIAGAAPQLATGSSAPAIYDASAQYVTGVILTVDVGSWSNNPTFHYQWYRADGVSAAVAIGTDSATYQTVAGDADRIISCIVTGQTTGGSTQAPANGIYIAASTGMPVNSVAPTVSGSTTVGATLTCAPGTWSNSPSFTYQWWRGSASNPISGATSSTYVSVLADGGSNVGCRVTATANSLTAFADSSNTIAVSGAGSGALSVQLVQQFSTVNLNTFFPVDWLVHNNDTSNGTRFSSGGSLITKTNQPDANANAGPVGTGITWSSGTPTASGTAVQGACSSDWASPGEGFDEEFSCGTASRVCGVMVNGYNLILDITVSLSDSSAAPVTTSIDTGAGASMPMTYIKVTGNAASSSQKIKVAIRVRSPDAYGGGDFHLRCAGIES